MKSPAEPAKPSQVQIKEVEEKPTVLELEDAALELEELADELSEVADKLADGGPLNPDAHFETVQDLVDALVDKGNEPQVFVNHDDHLGLEDNLSSDFLNSKLSEIENPDFKEQIEEVIEQANIILPLAERDITEDDLDDIKEDEAYRGIDHDD